MQMLEPDVTCPALLPLLLLLLLLLLPGRSLLTTS
jgi:hypothetical protein